VRPQPKAAAVAAVMEIAATIYTVAAVRLTEELSLITTSVSSAGCAPKNVAALQLIWSIKVILSK
jgi:hypothetical protein